MKTRNPIARVVRSIRQQIKAVRYPETMDCVECGGNGIIYAPDSSLNEPTDHICGHCNGTGVAR